MTATTIPRPRPAPELLTVRLDLAADATRVTLSGEMDVSTYELIDDALECAAEAGRGPVDLDLSAVSFVDCAGLAPVSAAAARLASRGRELRLDGAGEPVLRLGRLLSRVRRCPSWLH